MDGWTFFEINGEKLETAEEFAFVAQKMKNLYLFLTKVTMIVSKVNQTLIQTKYLLLFSQNLSPETRAILQFLA